MNSRLFTKSAFKQALDCPTSLYYYWDREHYANQNNEDDFLKALAEGGQQVGDLAKVYYHISPECDIKELGCEQSLKRTAELFGREEVNIAEAAFRWENCFVRADIIEKKGQQINLIEVKAKSWNPEEDMFVNKKEHINPTILPYLYDVTFQKYVIQRALGSEYTVSAFLLMADKTKTAQVDGMNPMFKVVENEDGKAVIVRAPAAESLAVMEHILTPFPVDDLCDKIIAGETSEQTEVMDGKRFTEFVAEMSIRYVGHERYFTALGKKCFTCPFFSNEKTLNKLDGKQECWKKMAGFFDEDFEKPSIAELWCGKAGKVSIKGNLVAKGRYLLTSIRAGDLPETKEKKGTGLIPSDRRMVQIAMMTGNDAMIPEQLQTNIHDGVYLDIPALKQEMQKWTYPLHMIDFETTAVPIPFYKGMHPYDSVAFQFSHHVIEKNGSIRHAGQYLNTKKLHFPNFEFVRELKRQLENDGGAIFRYATHENSILRAIRRQLIDSQESDKEELVGFIDSITHTSNKEKPEHKGWRDMVDLLELVQSYYYHPCMKGSNSIKAVLPAILNSSAAIRRKYEKPIYGKVIPSCNISPEKAVSWITYGPDGKVENPYKHLDAIAEFLGVSASELQAFDDDSIESESEVSVGAIANGGAALAAYTKLQFSDAKWTEAIKQALLRYCELDTMSMVFIWEYFHEMTGL